MPVIEIACTCDEGHGKAHSHRVRWRMRRNSDGAEFTDCNVHPPLEDKNNTLLEVTPVILMWGDEDFH